MKVLSAVLLTACLSGCAASGALTAGSGIVTGIQGTVEQTKASLVAQELAYAHNLLIMAEQIISSQGMVMMVPVATSPVPTTMPVTAVPVGPPTVLSPTLPVTPPSTAPTTTTIPPTPIIQ